LIFLVNAYLLGGATPRPILGFESCHAQKALLTASDENRPDGDRMAGNHRAGGIHRRAIPKKEPARTF
jgi:hypothetical protein